MTKNTNGLQAVASLVSSMNGYVDVDVYVKLPDGSEFLQRMSVEKSKPDVLIRDEPRFSVSKNGEFDDGGIVQCPDEVMAAFDAAITEAKSLIQNSIQKDAPAPVFQEITRAVIAAVLKQRAESGDPLKQAVAKVVETKAKVMAEALAHGTAHLSFGAAFCAIEMEFKAIRADIEAAFEAAREKEESQLFEDCQHAARARQVSAPPFHTGKLNREIHTYSDYEDEQAAYVEMCQATFKIGEVLLTQPRGTYLSNAQGGYWLSDVKGPLTVFMEWGSDPTPGACNVNDATYCEGIGAEDLRDITKTIEESLTAPLFRAEHEPGLLDALVLAMSASREQLDKFLQG